MSEYALALRTTAQLPRSRAHARSKQKTGTQRRPLSLAGVQPRLVVGPSNDPFEQEAERTAMAVTETRFSGPGAGARPVAASLLRVAQRALGKGEEPARKDEDQKKDHPAQKAPAWGGGPTLVPRAVERGITAMSGGGSQLDGTLRARFEARFGFDFSDVRIHSGREAAGAALSLGARAFTVGRDIFFGAGEYQPATASGQHLIAHELTHTIQQKPAAARAARLMTVTTARVQRWEGPIDKARNKIRDYLANDFPPWDLITLIIGHDPIRDVPVKGSTRDWIRAAMKLVPEGLALFEKLDKEGKVDAVAKWWDAEVAKLDLTLEKLLALVRRAWDALSLDDALDLVGAWNKKIKPIFVPVVDRVWNFIKAVGSKILSFVRDVVLKQIGDWAKTQRGYPLLTMVLGRDPVTGEAVTPTLKGVIFAVLDLVDETGKIKDNLEKSKTVEKAAAWFKREVKTLDITWEGIKLLFSQAWDAFAVADLLKPVVLFEKMWAIFKKPVERIFRFLVAVAGKVLEFVFEGAMLIAGPIGLQIVGIVRRIGSTFKTIINNPVTFVGHLVNAVKKGIAQFGLRIWEHLKNGLIGWLVGTLEGAGLVLPKVWDLRGILDLVLQILGISYPKIRVKLVKVIGEKTMGMLEKAFGFIKMLVTEGPAAAWKEIVAAIGSLWDMVIGGIKDWAVTKIVTAAITKLATMFNPAGAVIQAVIATYNTVAFFIERIKQIVAFVEAVVESIANIAEGKITAAANWIESAMARTIPVILGFLARLIGLGDVSGAVKKVITDIQAKVDKGIDAVIAWVVEKAKSLFGKADDKPVSAHEAILRDLVPRLEEEDPGPDTTDDEWLAAKRAKAEKLVTETKPKLAQGVGLSIVIKPGTLPRQFEFNMKISPNDTTAAGASAAPPILTVGALYTYYEDFKGNDISNVGKFDSSTTVGGMPALGFIPPGERETDRSSTGDSMRGKWKGKQLVPPQRKNGTPNFRLVGASDEPPVFKLISSRTAFKGGLQPLSVAAEPLAMVKAYTTPYQLPPGLARIAQPLQSAGDWVAGHLVNGLMGGPGSNQNLAPLPRLANVSMSNKHEKFLRGKLQLGAYFYYNAHVEYHSGAAGGIGRLDDFAKKVRVDYEEVVKDPSGWKKTGTKGNESYDVRLPTVAELDPGRVSS